jgi:hypothetical protein
MASMVELFFRAQFAAARTSTPSFRPKGGRRASTFVLAITDQGGG